MPSQLALDEKEEQGHGGNPSQRCAHSQRCERGRRCRCNRRNHGNCCLPVKFRSTFVTSYPALVAGLATDPMARTLTTSFLGRPRLSTMARVLPA